MIRISSIVLPTDYTRLAIAAAEYARHLALTHRAALHVVHFVEPVIVAVDPTSGAIPPAVDDITAEDRERLTRFVAAHFADVPNVRAELRAGFPSKDIAVFAASVNADLIVIGTHADGMLKRIIHGSVSKSVLESSLCPVLMVPQASIAEPKPEV